MARIAVIGAAGYVGQELSRQLKASGHDVVGIARANGSFLLERLGITHETPQRAQAVGRVDTVVNLAYPKSPSGFDYPAGNREILSTIRALAGTEARIVHASSLAVFGYALEHPQNPAPLDMRRDYFYIESKLELERLPLQGPDLMPCALREEDGRLGADLEDPPIQRDPRPPRVDEQQFLRVGMVVHGDEAARVHLLHAHGETVEAELA